MKIGCTSCTQHFAITDFEKALYERMDLPNPKECPDCRQIRRLSWRNERTLYKRPCDHCQKSIVSVYHKDAPFPVYCNPCWWSDNWDATSYGRDFDFSRPFFKQFAELQKDVPRLALFQKNTENSDYANHSEDVKNCYLTIDTCKAENVYYSNWIINCKDLSDCYHGENNELCYAAMYGSNNYKGIFLILSDNCQNSSFLYDCKSCTDCFMCWNLRHKKYCIQNEQLTKEEYEKRMQSIDLTNPKTFEHCKTLFFDTVKNKAIKKEQTLVNCERSSGDILHNCKNVNASYEVLDSEDCMYCYDSLVAKDCVDASEAGFACELQYNTMGCNRGTNMIVGYVSYDVDSVYYVDICHNSSDCFGCIGLRQKKFCILNKQYSEEEYNSLVPRIIAHMKETGEWGQFFPASISPFGYNESVAQEYQQITKEEAQKKDFRWHEQENKQTHEQGTRCTECSKHFRVTQHEADVYKRIGIAIPQMCADCRYKERAAQFRNPRRLQSRDCTRCHAGISSPYSKDRPNIFCERCYEEHTY